MRREEEQGRQTAGDASSHTLRSPHVGVGQGTATHGPATATRVPASPATGGNIYGVKGIFNARWLLLDGHNK